MLKDMRNIINGAVYGATLIVPGVSATIFAIMLGFYDELIETVNHFREDYRKNSRYIAAFLVGIVLGAVLFSTVVLYFLENYRFQTMMLFMGLLTGIIPLIVAKAKLTRAVKKLPLREILLALLFMTALLAISRLTPTTETNPTYANSTMTIWLFLYVLLAGVLNGATLVIPGLSGAFLLLIMGIYPLVIGAISSVGTFVGNPGDLTLLTELVMVLLPFGIGGAIGLLLMARLMEKLMLDHNEAVYASILGLVLGSVITLFLDFVITETGLPAVSIVIGVLLFCAGSIAAYMLGKRCDH